MKSCHALALVVALAAAGPAAAQQTTKPASARTLGAMPLVDAEVLKVDAAKGLIVLKHGDLPNLAMPPMTMGFDVVDKGMLSGIKAGDKVLFQAEMRDGKAMVTALKPRK
jgi:Cu(I)/Ag(I) efflux system membrane protein CusA/SilA